MTVMCGVPIDDGISDFNKCFITSERLGITVVGYMTEECQVAIRAIWDSPFEGDSIGNIATLDKAASLTQAASDLTSKTLWTSQQVWQGNEPPEVSLTLKFMAFTNAKLEVDDPIRYLCQMISPELQEMLPISSDAIGGRVPDDVMVDLGRKLKMYMRISEVSYNANAPKTKSGNFAYNTVNFTAAPKQMINSSVIPNVIF